MGARGLSYHWERLMTLFLPTLARRAEASTATRVASSPRPDAVDDPHADDDPTTTRAPTPPSTPLARNRRD